MFWCISYYLDAFETVWLSCETRCKTGWTSAKVCAMKSRSNFPQERNRSTPLEPKLIFCPVLYYLGAFGIVWLAYETWCKTGRTSAKVGNTKSRLNFSQWTHPIHPHWTLNSCFGVFCTIWVHLGSFSCLTKLGAKRAELVQKFVTQSRVGIFRNERTYSTPLDPKLIFWRILYYSGVFGTIVCLMKLGAKWAELVQKVRFHEVASKFFATNTPDPPHCIQKSCFGAFCTIWVHLG